MPISSPTIPLLSNSFVTYIEGEKMNTAHYSHTPLILPAAQKITAKSNHG
jgi:hypothetical protein